MLPTRYRVIDKAVETADTVTLDLGPVDGAISEPRAGQFTMLYAFGVGEAPISVSGLPGDEGCLRHTIRRVGAVTAALCGAEVGDMVGVRGPFGSAWGLDRARDDDVVVVAGGIGLAPLRAVVRHLISHRDEYGRASVLVGARSPDELLYVGEIAQWRGRLDLAVEVTVDRAGVGWRGDVGVVTTLLPRAPFDPNRTVALVCGPEVMMRFAARGLQERGVPAERIEVSLERNMQCAIKHCGHCQLGPLFVCADGPVVDWATIEPMLEVRGL